MNKPIEQLQEYTPEQFKALLLKYKPYLVELDSIVRKAKFGELSFTLRVHNGYVTDIVNTVLYKRYKYQQDKEVDPTVYESFSLENE